MEEQGDVSFFSTLSPFGVEVLAVTAAIGSYPVGPKVSIYCFPLLNNIALSGSPLIQIQLWLSPGFSNCSLPFVSSVEVLQGKALSLLPSWGTSELVTGSHCCSLLLLTSCCVLDMVLSA